MDDVMFCFDDGGSFDYLYELLTFEDTIDSFHPSPAKTHKTPRRD